MEETQAIISSYRGTFTANEINHQPHFTPATNRTLQRRTQYQTEPVAQ
jgi:hypothetical protein